MKRTTPVPSALSLQKIIDRIHDHKNTFWYVSRLGTVKHLQIYISATSPKFCRFYNALVVSKNVNKDIIEPESEWMGNEGTGWMYDHYYKYGHIFSDRSHAFSYLKERIDLNKKGLVKTARVTYNKYPEYHI